MIGAWPSTVSSSGVPVLANGGPMIALTPSSSSSWAARWVAAGSPWMSFTTYSTGSPPTPPASLMRSTCTWAASEPGWSENAPSSPRSAAKPIFRGVSSVQSPAGAVVPSAAVPAGSVVAAGSVAAGSRGGGFGGGGLGWCPARSHRRRRRTRRRAGRWPRAGPERSSSSCLPHVFRSVLERPAPQVRPQTTVAHREIVRGQTIWAEAGTGRLLMPVRTRPAGA